MVHHLKMHFLLKMVIFQCHVYFWGIFLPFKVVASGEGDTGSSVQAVDWDAEAEFFCLFWRYGLFLLYKTQMLHVDVSENSGFSPQIIHFNGVFHYFHHPFWDTLIFGNTHVGNIFQHFPIECSHFWI